MIAPAHSKPSTRTPEPVVATMDDDAGRTAEIDLALCRSALYEALALGFRPPSREMAARLGTRRGTHGLVVAAERVDVATRGRGPGEPGEHPRLAALVYQLAETDVSTAWLVQSYRRLFGHTVRGEAPAFETEYGTDDLFRQPQELADIAGFYAAFCLELAAAAGERPDHVSCECEFLMVLARKEAVALERGDVAMLAETRKATRLFLRDHLSQFVPALAERLHRVDGGGFYAALGALADALVHVECVRLDVTPGPTTLGLRTPVEDRIPMACGSCPLGAPDDGGVDAD